jgi:hypothetical protein
MTLVQTLFRSLRNITSLCLLIISFSSIADSIGHIQQVSGIIQLYKVDQFKPQTIKPEQLPIALHRGDKIRSKRKGEAVVYLQDGSTVLVTERSLIIFRKEKDHYIDGGKVLYDVRKQGGASGLIVATKSATIGVKGTQFMVKADADQQSIYLKKGLIIVEPNGESFKRSLARELDEFEQYNQQLKNGFESYKEKLKKEYIEYVQSISMNAGQAINISSENTVEDIAFTGQDEDDFSTLEQWSQR